MWLNARVLARIISELITQFETSLFSTCLPQKCHELHTRGPCGENETFVFSPPEGRPFCIYNLCGHPEMALHDDGRCYFLGERGPCGEDSELRLDERTKMPSCQPVKVKVGEENLQICNSIEIISPFC